MVHAASIRAKSPATFSWSDVLARIQTKQAKVGVIGLGYVGLPLAVAFARGGFSVTGFDLHEQKIADLQGGCSYIFDVPSSEVRRLMADARFYATTDVSALREMDALIICVPTPCKKNKAPDLSYVESAAHSIATILRQGQLVVLESTTYPGTTEELLVPVLESAGLKLFEHFQVAFSPERIDPGNPTYHVENTPKIVGGLGKIAGEITAALYGSVIEQIIRVDGPREAEMAKLIENTFRHVNIALANELGLIAKKMGLNIWQAIDAASSKPFGFMPFYPGPGVGGHCIPIDPHYLSWKAREMGLETQFVDLAERINRGMPEHVAHLVLDIVNSQGKSALDARVLLLGLAYKRDIDDMRESPALEILELLREHGAEVRYHDPLVPTCRDGAYNMHTVELTAAELERADCVVLVTDHSCFDQALIVQHATAIVDTRNALRAFSSENIIRL